MIVDYADLDRLRQQVAMVDGCFDPLHRGHIAYFKEAARLGLPVLCNIAPDDYLRTKHAPLLPREDRATIIDAVRYISYTHISPVPTLDVLRQLQPRLYVKGEDWRPRLPVDQSQLAQQLGIEIVYLPTLRDSSTRILDSFLASLTVVHEAH